MSASVEGGVSDQRTEDKILTVLKGNPRGMTIKQLSEQLDVSRETVKKSILALEYQNEIYPVKFGNAEVYVLNHKKIRDMDRIKLNFDSRTIFLNRLKNDYGEFILISETRKKGEKWEKMGSVLIPPDRVKEFIKALKDMDERPLKVQEENTNA